jgi:undecaprenyl-diphosphatase
MPLSTSFPSGHSASAAAFAVSVGRLLPGLRLPLRVAAGIVAFSRIYTGVHYPGDVVMGAALGTVVGRATSALVQRLRASSADQRASS